jgi:hypothetical protein
MIFLLEKIGIPTGKNILYSYWGKNYFPTGKKIDIPTGKNKLFSYWKKIYLIFLINSVCFLVCLPCHNLQLDPYSTFIKFNLADSSRREILHLK